MKTLRTASILSLMMAIAKGVGFAMSGSLVLLASLLDSLMDAILSWTNYKMSSAAKQQPDRKHPYGHGGFEVISAMLQGFLIAGSGVLVLFQTMDRVFSPVGMKNLDLAHIPIAFALMVGSLVVGSAIVIVLARSKRAARENKERSLSLEADSTHYKGDFMQNAVGIVGLAATWYWQSPLADVISGALCGIILLYTSYPLIRDCFRDIMNTEFNPKLQDEVQKIVNNSGIPEVIGMHRLRSRTLGPNHFIDFHLKLPDDIKLIDAHNVSYAVETLLRKAIPNIDVMIHLDPEAEPDDDL